MPSYNVRAINISSFNLGEADRVLTIFTPEKGVLKAVAKGARKPGSKMSGRADILCVNHLHLSSGRSFEIITQAQSIESFSALRSDLSSLTYALYYAELSSAFAAGLNEDCQSYFDYLLAALKNLANRIANPLLLCMEFELGLLEYLGYKPELTFCIACRDVLNEYNLSRFVLELGGIVCKACFRKERSGLPASANAASANAASANAASANGASANAASANGGYANAGYVNGGYANAGQKDGESNVNEYAPNIYEGKQNTGAEYSEYSRSILITPLVWKTLVLRSRNNEENSSRKADATSATHPADQAAQRLLQSYLELRAGKHFKSLTLLKQLNSG